MHIRTKKNKKLGEPSIKWKVVIKSVPTATTPSTCKYDKIGVGRDFDFIKFDEDWREAFHGHKYDFPHFQLLKVLWSGNMDNQTAKMECCH